ncbi:hypothetical protein [Pseudomonas sp. RIT-To-2]|uniref:hypothetical protein n=1 Tax=Pseudomonas sp. RIT-To-2 TaxID=3462541 RepID=UPI00241375EA
MSRQAAELVPVERRHVLALLADLRQADRVELESIRGWSAAQELEYALASTEHSGACIYQGKVLAIYGDTAHDETYGLPWMASSTWLERYPRVFLAECADVVAGMRSRHRQLINFADVRNQLAVRWLKWLGFNFLAPIPYGAAGEPFYPFTMEGTACAQ